MAAPLGAGSAGEFAAMGGGGPGSGPFAGVFRHREPLRYQCFRGLGGDWFATATTPGYRDSRRVNCDNPVNVGGTTKRCIDTDPSASVSRTAT